MKYAGIGSRQTPTMICNIMTLIAITAARQGYVLRSGAARGADAAFERGADQVNGQKEIFLPWRGFNGHDSPHHTVGDRAMAFSPQFHPNWEACSDAVKKLMARNAYQILGADLNDPVDFVICWTPNGSGSGGTGQAIRIAQALDIPVYDLGVFKNADILSKRFQFPV